MPFCPKCEDEYQEGFETCVDCQVSLVSKLGASEDAEKIEATEEAYAASFFDGHEEPVYFCPFCWNEFVVDGARCAPCGEIPVSTLDRPAFEQQVVKAPQIRGMEFDRLEIDPAEKLARIYVAKTPLEAGFILDSLLGMGLDAQVGHDGLDAKPQIGHGPQSAAIDNPHYIGVYISADEEEAAEMLLPEDGEFDEEGAPNATGDPYSRLVARAEEYREYRKYIAAAEILAESMALDDERPEAFLSLGMVAARRGHIEAARGAFEEAIHRVEAIPGRHPQFDELYYLSALYHFLDDAGRPSYGGTQGDRAWARLGEFVDLRPRQVEAQLFRLEAAVQRGSNKIAEETRKTVNQLNPRLSHLRTI